MSLEDKIYDLCEAIEKLGKAVEVLAAKTGGLPQSVTPSIGATPPVEEPKRRGRPPGKKNEEPATIEAPADVPAPEAPADEPAVEVTKPLLQGVLIEVVKKHGRDACGKLCRDAGGPNLSALDPKVYPALYKAAKALLATDAA